MQQCLPQKQTPASSHQCSSLVPQFIILLGQGLELITEPFARHEIVTFHICLGRIWWQETCLATTNQFGAFLQSLSYAPINGDNQALLFCMMQGYACTQQLPSLHTAKPRRTIFKAVFRSLELGAFDTTIDASCMYQTDTLHSSTQDQLGRG